MVDSLLHNDFRFILLPRYITYSKEDEAVRCIQSAHGFVLDGKPLR